MKKRSYILVSYWFVVSSVSAAHSCYGKNNSDRFKNFFNPISPCRNRDHMRFHWSVFSDHSTLMAFNSPSERLTRTQHSSADPFRETPRCLLLSWLHLLLRFTLYTGRYRQGHQEAFLWWTVFMWPWWHGALVLSLPQRLERHMQDTATANEAGSGLSDGFSRFSPYVSCSALQTTGHTSDRRNCLDQGSEMYWVHGPLGMITDRI